VPSILQLPDALGRDFRLAVRVLRKSPVFTVTAVLTLAIGIGANAAIFSVVDEVLLRALPYPEPDRLATIGTVYRAQDGEWESLNQTGALWETVRDRARSFDAAVSSGWVTGVNLSTGGHAVHVDQQRIGAGFFDVLGVAPRIGRGFEPEEDVPNGPAVAVLSHGVWTSAFGSDPEVIGSPILLRGEPYTVVGVMPEGFRSTAPADLWVPLRPTTTGEGEGTNYEVTVRLRGGVSWERASAEMESLGAAFWTEHAWGDEVSARFSLVPLRTGATQGLRGTLLILWAAAGVVLLIVCANLASLMLARSAARTREIAARMALGGGRGAVVRQVVVEGVVLAVLGGALGVVLGVLGLDILSGLARDALGIWQPIALDARVLVATGFVALATSLAFSLGPALHAARLDPRTVLAEGGARGTTGSAHWPRRLLVVAEVALGVLLVVFAGLLARTFFELRGLDDGFEPEGVVAGTLSLQDARYTERAAIDRLLGDSLERLRRIPGIEGAAVGLGLPYQRLLNLGFRATRADGSQPEPQSVSVSYVTPGYFETLRVPLLRGRFLEEADGPDAAPVAVVNAAFVERYLAGGGRTEAAAGGDPLAARVAIANAERSIVGVVGDVLQDPSGLGGEDPLAAVPVVYLSSRQIEDDLFVLVHTWFQPSWIVRSALPFEPTTEAMRRALHETDPGLPFAGFQRLGEVEAEAIAYQRFLLTLVATLAVIAALLAALGIHGLIANSVIERTREIGIRLALGATRRQVLAAVTVPGVVLAAAGTVLGTALALASSRVVGHFLWRVSATDPWVLLGSAVMVVLVAAGASLAPGRRVLGLDPARTLREE
jgi:putative ABC transport system permease protein